MRKVFAILAPLAAALAASVALVLPGSALAATCTANGQYVAHRDPGRVISVGQVFQADITLNSSNLTGSGGDLRAAIKVLGSNHTLIAGLIRSPAGGTQRYAELDGTFLFKVNASSNSTYTASITRNGSDSYTVKVGTNAQSGISVGTALGTTAWGVNNQSSSSTCNSVNYTLAGFGPWNDYSNWGWSNAPPYTMPIQSGGGTSWLTFVGP